MTTGHAPHTTPLWRRVLSLPHTRLGWWAIGLSAGSGLLLIFGLFLNVNAGLGVSPWVWMILIAGILAGAVVGLIALLRSPQHAPHTPRSGRVLSLPHTRLGWWAIGLTVGSVLLLIFGRISGVVGDPGLVMMIFIAGLLPGAVVGLIALLRSQEERSVLVWLAMVPVALVAAVPIAFMAQFLAYEVRHEVPIVSTVLPLVGMTAGVAALHFVQRGSERYGLGGTISSVASLIGVALIVGGILIGRVSQDWLLGTNLMGVGLWAATLGLAALAIITVYARVVPWWAAAALIVANPLGGAIIPSLLFSFLPESHNVHAAEAKIARALDLSASAEQWFYVGWDVAWGVVPWVVVGIAVLLAARLRTERPARVR